ncbi:MAG: putative extracellular nuclease [Flavobacteriales bacterium]|jgi:predicted extracellular nuclease
MKQSRKQFLLLAKIKLAMRILLSFLVCMTLISLQCCKSSKKTAEITTPGALNVLFYNVENLFDTEDDPNTFDEDFTPTGKLSWDEERYGNKLNNLSRVITIDGTLMPDLVGLCEVENRKVVEDLMADANFKGIEYKVVHKDSPDGRGIDVALAYNPKKLKVEEVNYISTKLPVGTRPNTRDAMHVVGISGGDTIHIFVNHWPSRTGGQEKSEPNRLTVARNVRKEVNKILEADSDAKILLMGDFNDYPNNKSLRDVLEAKKDDGILINLMWDTNKMGEGTYNYKGDWGALDQFIVSPSLMDAGLGYNVKDDKVHIIKEDWMMYTNKEGVAYPNRTYGGKNYYGGFSDHLPIRLVLDYSGE